MGSSIDLEAQQVPQAAPRAEVGGVETQQIDILGPPTSSAAGSLRSVNTAQDVNEAQSVISRVEGSGGSDVTEMNIDQSRSSGDVSGATSDRLTQAGAQTDNSTQHTQHNSNTNENQYDPLHVDLNTRSTTRALSSSNQAVDHQAQEGETNMAGSGSLPAGWVERRTPDGRTYYVDHNTRSTTWARPSSNQAVDHQAQEGETNTAGSGSLPAGWEERRTPGGQLYYVDHSTQSNTWVDPRHQITHPTFKNNPEEPRMIGDFDGSSNALWTLFKDEAKNHDDARIYTLKEDMESALIFAGLFSAALTAFVVNSIQDLKSSPADETVYYLRQHSTILSQISVQLSSIAPQVSIPSTPPPPFPAFKPSASGVRVNTFWFMSLVFSLLAALFAILVQQWVRDYMHVFQRYGDPLKSGRLRQYLYEGCEGWYMPMVADAVPGYLHVSLFLFFIGLGNSLLVANTKVALTTIVPIGISGLLYILITFARIIHPQSPYKDSFSGIFWYLFQKSRGRRFKDRGSDGEMKSVSTDMAQGQMQLAMERTEARKGRDVRAIRWLIDPLTEDAEMEKFLSAIPGSFNTDWGTEVWRRVEDQSQDEPVARPHSDTTAHQPSSSWSIRSFLRPVIHLVNPHSTTAHIQGENVVHELGTRVARSVEICKNRNLFSNNELWRKRTRACIEATASLVCCANAKLAWFGDISKLLGDIGSFEKIRELSLARSDELFVIRWTCLSLVAIRPILENDEHVQIWARRTMGWFSEEDDTGNNDALATAQKINEILQKARGCLFRLYAALPVTEDLTDEVKEILRGHESQISELEHINNEADRLKQVDIGIYEMQYAINRDSHQITSQIPGILDNLDYKAPIPFSHLVELSHDPRKLQFIRPRQTLKSLCSPALTLRNILEGQVPGAADAYKEVLKNLKEFRFQSRWQGDWMQRQSWRPQDLDDAGGFGFIVELFFLALSQLSSTYSSKESHSALYTGTFQAITSDWSKHKHSVGTQKLLLDIAILRCGDFEALYPDYIVDEFLSLLHNIFEGEAGSHIHKARQQIESFRWYDPRRFRERVLRVLTRGQAQSPAS